MGSRPVRPELHSKTLFQKERKKEKRDEWEGGRESRQASRQEGETQTDQRDRLTE